MGLPILAIQVSALSPSSTPLLRPQGVGGRSTPRCCRRSEGRRRMRRADRRQVREIRKSRWRDEGDPRDRRERHGTVVVARVAIVRVVSAAATERRPGRCCACTCWARGPRQRSDEVATSTMSPSHDRDMFETWTTPKGWARRNQVGSRAACGGRRRWPPIALVNPVIRSRGTRDGRGGVLSSRDLRRRDPARADRRGGPRRRRTPYEPRAGASPPARSSMRSITSTASCSSTIRPNQAEVILSRWKKEHRDDPTYLKEVTPAPTRPE